MNKLQKISNITRARKTDGTAVTQGDLKEGLLVTFPSGAGGVVKCKCTSVNKVRASFVSVNRNWPMGFDMRFNQPDMSLTEMEALNISLTKFSAFGQHPTTDDRKRVHQAITLGYAISSSFSQAVWTEEGLNTYKNMKEQIQPGNAQI